MVKLHRFLPFFLLLAACNNYYYAPNTLHQPLLRERNDASVRAGLGLGSNHVGTEIQGAYSPLKHLAVQYNYFYIKGRSEVNSGSPRTSKGHLQEGAIGTYWNLTDAAQLSLYGGYGRGNVFNSYVQDGVTSELTFERWFAQPGLIVYDNKLRFNLGVRLSYLAYLDGIFDTRLEGREREDIFAIQANSPYLLIETALGFSLHMRPVVLSLNLVNSQSRNQDFAYKRSYSNLAAAFDIHDLYRKKR